MPKSRHNPSTWLAPLALAGLLSACAHPAPQPERLSWNFFFDGQEAKLAYGRPNSDEVGLMMSCQSHSGSVLVASDTARVDPRLALVSGKSRTALAARAEPDPLSGANIAQASAPVRDAALTGFARSGRLTLVRDGQTLPMDAGLGERDAVRRFFSACA